MLKEIRFKDWKSFRDATLYIDPLTVLIGANASGKSNALDGIAFLNRTAQGETLQNALTGEPGFKFESSLGAIRGGAEWAARKPGNTFTLEAIIQCNEQHEYKYGITVKTNPQVELISEFLTEINNLPRTQKQISLFRANVEQDDRPVIMVDFYIGKGRPKKEQFKRTVSVLSQLKNQKLRKEVEKGIECVIRVLETIFILDPVPAMMRDYTPLSSNLATNASNLAGMLAALPDQEKKRIELMLSKYVSRPPEGDIRRVWAERVGRFKNDAMIYCEEKWTDEKKTLIVDARGMSDGTLRFLGILTALLTRQKGTLVISEVCEANLSYSVFKGLGFYRLFVA